ncbi:MAG: hypothetical protein DWB56_12535 [Candidatus Jettenia sp.]|uniref:SEC-C metal-binding domain-containing protein n=1 Tax=Candidatus Jettenia sp. AMX1 TaxID=2293637 RepID=UPI00058C705D|nr:SEC-C metal-binding domain-containing protein [Candidatus Jettenia sp. AMX1]MBC6929763.1 hypothetical protein [Candidatus Jettenia sp.]GIL18887.1 MAG: hypothetical protein BroJett041_00010 [Candidatus Jettenia caeni]KAA0248701.1 MAG: hypothetical protein EDM77_11400 [Candidatus Jettenia sp. AMX1]MCE7880680.1 hypothetical protein [Candidatus Jettenia sp. AMX1]MCQ3927424.1 hypothetical protein [Candidatus Jettenia sp.]
MVDYQTLDDESLVKLLFTEADRLPRAAVDEFVRRGERMIKPLDEIVSKESCWRSSIPEWWAVIHAVFILGAIDTKEAVLPLMRALRLAETHDVDWITTVLPSIFGKLGMPAIDELKKIVKDKMNDWRVKDSAVMGLAAITINHPEIEDDIFPLIHSVLTDTEEDIDVRGCAGNVLLDFVRSEYKESLLAFCEEEEKAEKDEFEIVAFSVEDVKEVFSKNEKNIDYYTKDWLSFYDEDEIKKRQERWRREEEEELEYLEEDEEFLEPFTPEKRKIGRNEPCPCGSGKKYKKCCMNKEK